MSNSKRNPHASNIMRSQIARSRERLANLRCVWKCMDVLGRSVRPNCPKRFVGVGHRYDALNRRMGGVARSNSSALYLSLIHI